MKLPHESRRVVGPPQSGTWTPWFGSNESTSQPPNLEAMSSRTSSKGAPMECRPNPVVVSSNPSLRPALSGSTDEEHAEASNTRAVAAPTRRRLRCIRPRYSCSRKTPFGRENQTPFRLALGTQLWHSSVTGEGKPDSEPGTGNAKAKAGSELWGRASAGNGGGWLGHRPRRKAAALETERWARI